MDGLVRTVKVIDDDDRPKARSSTPEVVAHELRRHILDGTIGPGERINVRDLERRLNVSHIPIREAMRMLEAEGLVESRPNVGAVASEVSISELEDVYDFRRMIEPAVAQRAVERMTETEISNLRRVLAQLEALEDVGKAMDDDHIAVHRRFHWLLLEPGATPTIELALARLWRVAERYVRLTRGAAVPVADEQHRSMVDLCEAGDGEGLGELLNEHLHLTANTLQVLYCEEATTRSAVHET